MRQITYSKRDFASLREEQVNFIKRYYPEVIGDFSDASIMSVFLDLNAAIADNLHYYIDTALNETVLDFAQRRSSLFNIASTYGLTLPTKSASVALCDVSIEVPVRGDSEDVRYLPIMKAGSQFSANGIPFETITDVDFSQPTNSAGFIDRTKVPNQVNGNLVSYTITKKVIVVNGATRVYSQTFGNEEVQPFYNITLPENNVLSIESVITKNGTNFNQNPAYSEFLDDNLRWYQVKSLAEDKVFVRDNSREVINNVIPGTYKNIDKKFIKTVTPNGFTRLTFGSQTDESTDVLDDFLSGDEKIALTSLLNNRALGLAPQRNSTMWVKYRIGGGEDTNVGAGTINEIINPILVSDGPNSEIVQTVTNSLTINNPIPSIGGSEEPTLDELRYYIGYNFSAQNRAVTLRDYKTLVRTMPSVFGTPSKVGVRQNKNKIEINILNRNSDGHFSNVVNSLMLENIAEYLSEYRMINDFIDVRPGEVIDLGFEVEVLVDPNQQIESVNTAIIAINELFNTESLEMGKSFYIGDIYKALSNVSGILNVINVRAFNKVGGNYSLNEVSQPYINSNIREIDISEALIFADENQILQVRNPQRDVLIRPRLSTITRNNG